MEHLNKITVEIEEILAEIGLPKHVRNALESTQKILKDEQGVEIRIAKAIEALDELNDYNNIPAHLRTQLWSLASALEHTQSIS